MPNYERLRAEFTSRRISLDAQAIPLGVVLQTLAEQTDLQIDPDGSGVALKPWPTIRVNGDERRTEDSIRGELFLMVREALYNAIVHARPSYISAHIDIMPDEIRAVIEDDGEGFDPSRVPQTSTGLASLNERLQLLNGLSKIESIMGTGTRIVIQIPLPKPAGG